MTKTVSFGLLGLAVALCVFRSPAHAETTRTWVSRAGRDSTTCTRTLPCATLAYAFSQVSVGGESNVLGRGDFGSLTITHSVSIYSDDVGVLDSRTSGITISAGVSDIVNLRGLVINGNNSSLAGILLTSGGML